MDGTQARLKPQLLNHILPLLLGGKGGWDSGEIETALLVLRSFPFFVVERVDGTQARLKPQSTHEYLGVNKRWKGWMGLRRD